MAYEPTFLWFGIGQGLVVMILSLLLRAPQPGEAPASDCAGTDAADRSGDMEHPQAPAAELIAQAKRLLSSDLFSVDGTLLEAWASPKSFRSQGRLGRVAEARPQWRTGLANQNATDKHDDFGAESRSTSQPSTSTSQVSVSTKMVKATWIAARLQWYF